MVRFDAQAREVVLSVRDLLELEAARVLRPEPFGGLRARAGGEAHRRRRQEREEASRAYRAEEAVELRLERRGYRVTIQGRIDGLFEDDGRWVVEEVKTVVFDLSRFAPGELERAVLEEGAFAEYRLQLELYLFLFRASLALRVSRPFEASRGGPGPSPVALPEVRGRLVLRSLARAAPAGTQAVPEQVVEVPLEPARVQAWIEARLDILLDRLEAAEAERAGRERAAETLCFPFPSLRPHQEELMAEVRRALEEERHLLISAPTGIGKTAAVLHPALRFALERGRRVIYVTAKTTQKRLVADTAERMARASGWEEGRRPPFRAVVLRAREKVCPNLEEEGFIYCHEDFCRYARDHAAKAEEAASSLLLLPVALPEDAVRAGRAACACPYELSLDVALEADLVVGDYNHVFDPQSRLGRLLDDPRWRQTVLIIDEAHNLYPRGRESYSPALERREVRALGEWAREEARVSHGEAAEAFSALAGFSSRLEGLFASLSAYGRDELGDPPVYRVELAPAVLQDLSRELEESLAAALAAGRLKGVEGPGGAAERLSGFAGRFGRFVSALEALEGAPFLLLYDKSSGGRFAGGGPGHRLRVLCLEPAVPLGRRLSSFGSAVAISATLEPLDFFRDVLGFPAARTTALSFPSPFPPENRRVLVHDRVSTYFRSRGRDAAEVARLIAEVAAAEPGNYLACFPSYAYLEEVRAFLGSQGEGSLLVQTPGMSEEERDRFLALLGEPGSARTVLAVQGGIFTEGVDYPGRMLSGVIVVGPGLPAVTFDEEMVRAHFEDRYGEGFAYAYLYPGMNRVVQCAGRVIRSETDVGVIVLLGERFRHRQYSRLFPREWYRSSPEELAAEDLGAELRSFWAAVRSRKDASHAIEALGDQRE